MSGREHFVKVSLSDWRTAVPSSKWAGLASYQDLNADPAWTEALHHILLFTVTFILGTLLLGNIRETELVAEKLTELLRHLAAHGNCLDSQA